MPDSVPRLALTPGEPAGIGPDLVIRLARDGFLAGLPAATVIIADPELLQERARQLQLEFSIPAYDPAQAPRPGHLSLLPVAASRPVQAGQPDPANARYVLQTLERACRGCLDGEFTALVTGPVQKSIINEGGFAFSGHTEYLAGLCGVQQTVMLLSDGELQVALATTHIPLSAVAAALTRQHLETVLRILQSDLQQRFGLARPRIRVLGLNPHAGEAGHLGREEIDIIMPVIHGLQQCGWSIQGPVPADTAFLPAVLAQTDVYLAMYHDQGLPVLKARGFGHTVNITLGLPMVRTSVDHGTALELAGSDRVDSGSLACALQRAIELAPAG